MIKKGSIVAINVLSLDGLTNLLIIGIASKIVNDFVYCKHSVTSQNGGEFKPTKEILSSYKGEPLDWVKLVSQDEFDLVYDSNLIPKHDFINV